MLNENRFLGAFRGHNTRTTIAFLLENKGDYKYCIPLSVPYAVVVQTATLYYVILQLILLRYTPTVKMFGLFDVNSLAITTRNFLKEKSAL